MAEDFDKPNFDFGIQDTMSLGSGDAQLVSDLFSSDTATEAPENIEPIIKEVKDPAPKPSKIRGKEIIPTEEGVEPTPQDTLTNFLNDATDENNEDDDTPTAEVKQPEAVDNEQESETSQFTALSNDLFKLGVFTSDEGEQEAPINTGEEFLERFKAEKQKGAIEMVNNFIGQFGEDYQNAFEAIFVKGLSPREYFGIYNNIVDYANLNLVGEENEANQIAVIRQALTDQGFEPEDISTEIDRLKNYGDLESVATKHHKVLVKKEAAKLAEKEAQAERELQQKVAIKSQYIQNVQSILQEKLKTKEFDGIPINPKLATELQEFLLQDKWKTPSGETLTDFDRAILDLKRPENHALKVKIALLFKILEKDPTLSTIQRAGISKKSDTVFTELARQTTKTKTSNLNSQPTSWFSQTNH